MEYKKDWIKILLFCFIAVPLVKMSTIVLTPNNNLPLNHNNVGLSINEFENLNSDIEVLFAGTSHMESAVSPMQIYQDEGIPTYNIATPLQSMIVTRYFISECFDRGMHPKVIVIDVGSLFLRDVREAQFRYVADTVKLDKNKLTLIYEYEKAIKDERYDAADISESGSRIFREYIGFLFPLYKYHSRWDSLNMDDFSKQHNRYYFMQGFVGEASMDGTQINTDLIKWEEQVIEENQSRYKYFYNGKEFSLEKAKIQTEPSYYFDIDTRNIECLKEIKEICERNNCNLLLVKIPVMASPKSYDSSWTMARSTNVKMVSNELDIPFVDMLFDVDLGLDWNHDTFDGGYHLNFAGAEKATKFLGKYLVENYDLVTKRNSEYDAKLELYDKYAKIAGIEMTYDFPEYLHKLNEYSNELEIYMSARDDMSTSLTDEDITALKDIGLESDFGNMELWDSFIAILDKGNVICEGVSNRRQTYKARVGYNDVELKSSGDTDVSLSSILINGREYSMDLRGINIVVYDKESGLVIDRAVCDTWSEEHEVKHDIEDEFNEYEEYLLGRGH